MQLKRKAKQFEANILPVIEKSHCLRASDDLHIGLEIEAKIDFLEILLIFNFCPEMIKNACMYIFFNFSLPFP